MNLVPLDQLSFEALAGLAGTSLRVWVAPQEYVDLQMCAASARQVRTMGGLEYEQFSLTFLSPLERLLPQRIYTCEAATIGRLELFIVPIGRDPSGIRYQAAFNRLVKAHPLAIPIHHETPAPSRG